MKGPVIVWLVCGFLALVFLAAAILRILVWMGAKRLRDEMATKPPVIRFDLKRKRRP